MIRKSRITGSVARCSIVLLAAMVLVAACSQQPAAAPAGQKPAAAPAAQQPAPPAPAAQPTAAKPAAAQPAAAQGGPPIVFGKVESLTGSTAFEGVRARDGAILAVKRANEEGGVLGRQIVLKIADAKSDPAGAVSAMEDLIAREKPVAMLAPYGSPYGVPIGTAMAKYGLPTTFIYSALDPNQKVVSVYPWAFSVGVLQAYYYKTFVDILKLAQKSADPPKTIALTYVNGAFGEGMARLLQEGFPGLKGITEATGLKIVAKEPYDPTATDLRPLLLRLKALNPDILYETGNIPDTILMVKQMREIGLGVKMFFSPFTPLYADVIKGLGPTGLEGVTTIDLFGPGVEWPASEKYPKLLPSTVDLAKAVKDAYGADLDSTTTTGYNQAAVLIAAMREAGSMDKTAVSEALAKLKTNTPNGPADFTVTGIAGDRHEAFHHLVGFQYQNGKAVALVPSDIAKGKLQYPVAFK